MDVGWDARGCGWHDGEWHDGRAIGVVGSGWGSGGLALSLSVLWFSVVRPNSSLEFDSHTPHPHRERAEGASR